ncbi:MAG: hypothetical protein AB4352_24805 [Hormoscilla sp.]
MKNVTIAVPRHPQSKTRSPKDQCAIARPPKMPSGYGAGVRQ